MEIETFFLVFLLFKQVREEGTLNRGGCSFEIMANGVGAYLGEDARLERGRLMRKYNILRGCIETNSKKWESFREPSALLST